MVTGTIFPIVLHTRSPGKSRTSLLTASGTYRVSGSGTIRRSSSFNSISFTLVAIGDPARLVVEELLISRDLLCPPHHEVEDLLRGQRPVPRLMPDVLDVYQPFIVGHMGPVAIPHLRRQR